MQNCSCGGLLKSYVGGFICTQCGNRTSISSPEKLESKTKLSLPIRIAQIILRDDNGPTDERSSPEQFIEFRPGKFIDLKFLDSVPALGSHQLDFCDE